MVYCFVMMQVRILCYEWSDSGWISIWNSYAINIHTMHTMLLKCFLFYITFFGAHFEYMFSKGSDWLHLWEKVEGMEIGLTLSLKIQEGVIDISLLEGGCYVKDIIIKLDGGASWLYQGYGSFKDVIIIIYSWFVIILC